MHKSIKPMIAAMTFAAMGALVSPMAPMAIAQDAGGAGTPAVNQVTPAGLMNIDPAAKAMLTIHKYEGNPVGGGQQGVDTQVNLPGLDGVEFTIQKITNLDPRNFADWEAFSKLDPNAIPTDRLGAETKVTTANGGVATYEGDLGFYLVKEIQKPGRSSIAPTLVALPMTHPGKTTWNYDVHIHPKNQMLSIKKEVADLKSVTGNDINYTITGDVPAPNQDGSDFNRYVIVDDYDETKFMVKDSTIEVTIGGQRVDATHFTATNADGKVKIELTAEGLKLLTQKRTADENAKVIATMTGTITGEGIDNLKILENTAYLFSPYAPNTTPPDDPNDPGGDPNTPSSKVESRYGNVEIMKTGADNKQALEGAVFELYHCEDNSNTITGSPISVGGKTEFTTNDQGKVTIKGIQLSNYANGEAVADDDFDYCLVEKKAPEGYELLPKPINFDLTDDSTFVYAANIENIPENGGFELPATGGIGFGALVLAGLATAGAGLARNRKKDGEALVG